LDAPPNLAAGAVAGAFSARRMRFDDFRTCVECLAFGIWGVAMDTATNPGTESAKTSFHPEPSNL